MRPDLNGARASVAWAKSNFPAFQDRLQLWLRDNVQTAWKEDEANPGYDILVAIEKEPLPLRFSAEAGAYINSIRSGLDMVAWAVFKRDLLLEPDEVYFPIAESEERFISGSYKGYEFIKQLNGTDRKLFELLKPYRGGNDTLYFLHRLDIIRKHRVLLSTEHRPKTVVFKGTAEMREKHFRMPNQGPFKLQPRGEGETVIAFGARGAPKPEVDYTPTILLKEGKLGVSKEIMPLLGEFARHAEAIIETFNY